MTEPWQGVLFAVADVPPVPMRQPEDAEARRAAVDIGRSILVQAPAGAGKTDLLTRRFLALLAEVDEPEQILAITFTRAATAEMRSRIVGALQIAQQKPVAEPGEDDLLPTARRALAHSEAQGWRLLEQPHRLDVQTIDSLCLRLAHGQPLLARLGGALSPTEDATALYAAAARRTTALLGQAREPELDDALATLLLRRDNNLHEVERLVAAMLARRDAWLAALPLRFDEEVDWDEVRRTLEEPFARENRRVLEQLCSTLSQMPEFADELVALGRYAGANAEPGEPDLRLLAALERTPGPQDGAHWLAIAHLLLTGASDWRKDWNKNQGFPASSSGPNKQLLKEWKERMKSCGAAAQAHELGGDLLALLCRLRGLPPLHYSSEQWATLQAALRVLRRAAAELRLLFAETNTVDFIEIAQAAETVLQDEANMHGLLESEHKRHLLIDEFQDTSRAQYRLVAELLREWQPGDGRSVFVVGDPLQSIYSFRQAEVALFHETRERGLPCGKGRRHRCHTLQLTHNFRSHAELVTQLNARFERVFAGSRAASFVAAHAWPQPHNEPSFQLHTSFVDHDSDEAPGARGGETAEVIRVLQAELPRIADAEKQGEREYRVAVLVQSRSHLASILPALREARIPYRAIDLEPLGERPEVHDLHMLLRALLHPGDRLAWLTVLRAPWCGLRLADLHMLCGNDDPALLHRPLPELISSRLPLLSPDGQQRLGRVWAVLRDALRTRYHEGNSVSLAAWVERAWIALGGPACVDRTARENSEAFLRLLDSLEPSGVEVLRGDFAQRLTKLCAAPNAEVSERFGIQLMTIHKSKGLGFEVVLLPGLDRRPRADGTELIAMLERAEPDLPDGNELLAAPVGSRENEDDDVYQWVMRQRKTRDADERKRLFYVACTRARTRLHLFANVTVKDGTARQPAESSLLAAAWPALEAEVATQLESRVGEGLTLAAETETAPPRAAQPLIIERLPAGWGAHPWAADLPLRNSGLPLRPLFMRAEGSLAARARGTALHALLEQMAALFAEGTHQQQPTAWRPVLERIASRILRASAYPGAGVSTAARELSQHALNVVASDTGRWLLHPHPGALAESTWQSWDSDGNLRTLRVDRSFLAGEEPGQMGERCLWIVDYKTGAHTDQLEDEQARTAWLDQQKKQWSPQLEAYGAALEAAQTSALPLRYGLYFPELLHLISWAAPSAV